MYDNYYNKLVQTFGSSIAQVTLRVTMTANGKSFLPENANLNNNTVVGMYYNALADLSPDGDTLANKNQIDNSFITLKSGNYSIIEGAPLGAFAFTDERNPIMGFQIDRFTTTTSFLDIDASLATAGSVYLLTFLYLKNG